MSPLSASAPAGSRPETELLLACARPSIDLATSAQTENLLTEAIDWEHLLRIATQHGIMPLLYQHLQSLRAEAVDQSALDHLRERFRGNAYRNLFLAEELCRILRLLEDHDIQAVPLKGPTLATMAYGNLALRQFGDLDILLREGDIPDAKEVLISRGYRPLYMQTRAQERAQLRYDCEYALVRDDDNVLIELHWDLVPKLFARWTEQLWGRLEQTTLGGQIVRTVRADDLLLLLCIHGTKHFWSRLGWISAVAALISRSDIRWEAVMDEAGQQGAERMLLLGLLLANSLLEARIPEDLLERAQADRDISWLAARVHQLLFSASDGSMPDYPDRSLFYLRALDRRSARLRYCLRYLTSPTEADWNYLPLPDALFPAYYLLRPIRLTGRMRPWLLKALC